MRQSLLAKAKQNRLVAEPRLGSDRLVNKTLTFGPPPHARAFFYGATGERRVYISGLLVSGGDLRSGHNVICASSPHQVINLERPCPHQSLKKL
jgi:hypothetical protein